ncbi:hypothetical protein T484DRAFT_2609496 [Baffinella frigidus]|nr:hypothetical protein T484DRAFT_2609496 [Cryptophyta sp. CCMP2293]
MIQGMDPFRVSGLGSRVGWSEGFGSRVLGLGQKRHFRLVSREKRHFRRPPMIHGEGHRVAEAYM